jgi:hypothetical protein
MISSWHVRIETDASIMLLLVNPPDIGLTGPAAKVRRNSRFAASTNT